ncbi:MAG TPA: RDD family protein [Micromonosporaceae bacterium]|nr:RDD family protein [Micromonosporaceae bacterium]
MTEQQWSSPPPPGYAPPPRHIPQQGYGYPGPPPPRPLPLAPNGAPLAEFSDRVVAFIIDYAILLGISLIFTIPAMILQFSIMTDWMNQATDPVATPPEDLGAFYAEFFRSMLPLLWVYLVLFVLQLALYYVYRVEMMFRTGQTIGKRVMKIRVVPVDPALTLTRGMATKRWLVDSVGSVFVPLLAWIDGLWQLWDQPFRQCLHDKFAQTVVVKAPVA